MSVHWQHPHHESERSSRSWAPASNKRGACKLFWADMLALLADGEGAELPAEWGSHVKAWAQPCAVRVWHHGSAPTLEGMGKTLLIGGIMTTGNNP